MKLLKRAGALAGLLSLTALTALTACSSGNTVNFRNEAKIGGFDVSWAQATAMAAQRTDGLTPMMFIIVPSENANTAKPASLEQRKKLAEAALGADPKCEWAGFDAKLNADATMMLGGRDHTLYALARCK